MLQKEESTGKWVDVKEITLPQDGKWEYTWNDLDVGSKYRVTEVNPPENWKPTYSDENNGLTLAALAEGEETPQIVVTNTWRVRKLLSTLRRYGATV